MSGSLIYTARTNRLLTPNSTPQVESTNNINQPTAKVIQPYEHPLQTVLNATQNMTSTQDKTTFFKDNSNGIVEMPSLNVATTLWQPFGGDILNVQGLKSNQDNAGFQYYGRSVALSDDAQFLAVSAWFTPEISNNVVDIYQYSDISNIWEQFQRIYNNTSPDTYHGYYITFNTLSDNTIRLFIGDDSGTNTNNVSTGTVTMYELNSSNFYEMKARQFGDEDGEFAALVDQKQDSYIVVAGPTNDTSNKIRKISIYTPDFLTRVLTIIVPTSFGVYSPADIQIDQSSNYIYFIQNSSGTTSTERQDLYIYNIKNYREDPNIQEITLTEEANLAKQFKSVNNQANNSISTTYIMGLSVSNNGEYIVVGKSWLQADVYHLDKTTDTIRLVYQIYPPKDIGFQGGFAQNVSMSGDGKRIAVFYNGMIPYRGGVIIYETQDYQEWHQIGNHIVGDDYQDGYIYYPLNNQINLSADGRVVAIGYPFAETPETRVDAGYARTYRLTENTSILRADSNGVTFNGPLELDVLHVKDAIKFPNNNNIHMGYLAGDAAKSGSNNIRLGNNAGHDAQNTSDSIAIGTYAGSENQQEGSIAIGNSAGRFTMPAHGITIGTESQGTLKDPTDESYVSFGPISIGYKSASKATGHFCSIAIGADSMRDCQNSHADVAIGRFSLPYLEEKQYNNNEPKVSSGNNVALGATTGTAMKNGNRNIFIGAGSGIAYDERQDILDYLSFNDPNNNNKYVMNDNIYLGSRINALTQDVDNEIIIGSNINGNQPGRGTNVMILGNDTLQRIIIPSYQNLKNIIPEYDGQLYIDASNNLKVYEISNS